MTGRKVLEFEARTTNIPSFYVKNEVKKWFWNENS